MSTRTRRLVDDRSRIHRDSRSEIKYVLDRATGEAVARALSRNSDLAESPQGDKRWEVQSTYFDDAQLTLVKAAHRQPGDCVKVRTRDYPRAGNRPPERVWLEIKRRLGTRSEKVRFPILRAELPEVLRLGREHVAGGTPLESVAMEAVEELQGLCEGHALLPVAEVHYWRQASFLVNEDLVSDGPEDPDCAGAEEESGEFGRVTLDSDLRFRLPALTRDYAHRDPTAAPDAFYLEVKGAAPPAWLQEVLHGRRAENFSKFVLVTTEYQQFSSLLSDAEAARKAGRGRDSGAVPGSPDEPRTRERAS